MVKNALFAASAALSLFFIACEESNPVIQESKPFYSAFVYAGDDYWDETHEQTETARNIEVIVYSYNAPKAATLAFKLNDNEPDLVFNTASNDGWWDCTFSDGFFFDEPFAGQKILSITSDLGTATSEFRIPDPTIVTSHNDGDTISPSSNIVVTWTGNADWYIFNVTGYVDYRNSTGIYDTAVAGNTCTVLAHKISDEMVMVHLTVLGVNGPQPVAGSPGNISGNGKGFVFAANYSGERENWDMLLFLRDRLGKTSIPEKNDIRIIKKMVVDRVNQAAENKDKGEAKRTIFK